MANASNTAVVTFGANSGGASQTITHFGIGSDSSGTGHLFASAALNTQRDIAVGATPKFEIGELDVNLTTSNTEFESSFLIDMLELYFQNLDHPYVGDTAGLQNSAAAGSFYISLHTASPAGGNQQTSEATYTGYARVAVARSAGGWTVA